AGDGGGQTERLDDGRALGAPVDGRNAGDVVGGDASLAVGRTGQRHGRAASGDVVDDFRGVPDGVDVRRAGAHVFVHHDVAAGSELDAGAAQEVGVRTD